MEQDKVLEERIKRREEGPGNPHSGMTVIVKTVTRLTVGLILLFGIYIVLHGSILHGGGFAGGVIIALSFIHIVLAYGKTETLKMFPMITAFALMCLSALVFALLGLAGILKGGLFMNFLPKIQNISILSGGLIPMYNILIGLLIGSSLFAIFLALLGFKKEED